MSEIKQILCAIDLSDATNKVISKAKLITHMTSASLTLIHTIEHHQLNFLRRILGGDEGSDTQAALNKVSALLEAEKNKLLASNVKVDTVIEQGVVTERIHAYSNKIKADLLVIGANGKSTLQSLFLGSTALKILRNSLCPVLIAKDDALTSYRRVLIGVDFSQDIQATIAMVKSLTPDAEIVLAHFYEIPFEGKLSHYSELNDPYLENYRTEIREHALNKMNEIADTAHLDPLKSNIVVVQGDAVDKLLFMANDYGCDLLVLGKHGTNVADEWLLGSVTNEIINVCEQDVLVMTQQKNVGG
ncbi:MAG: universal stress protein [Methylophilus sp.]|nr:universal stress protein [Methylophilus sp.]